MATVVHPVVQDANNEEAGFIGLEEDAVTPADSHLDAWPEVISTARGNGPSEQALQRVTKGIHVRRGPLVAPGTSGVATNRVEIRPRSSSLGETEMRRSRTRLCSIDPRAGRILSDCWAATFFLEAHLQRRDPWVRNDPRDGNSSKAAPR